MNDEKNGKLYEEYRRLVEREEYYLWGRLSEYRYYDMDQVRDASLAMVEKELG